MSAPESSAAVTPSDEDRERANRYLTWGRSMRDGALALEFAAVRAEARAAEREACAVLAYGWCADHMESGWSSDGSMGHPPCCHAADIAAAIRARGKR